GVSVAFPKLTLVVEFVFMAFVLVFRPWGLLGKPLSSVRHVGQPDAPLRPATVLFKWFALALIAVFALLPALSGVLPYASVLAQYMLIVVLFAVCLYFLLCLCGMPSFGHAAYFGIGAYAAALLFKSAGLDMTASLLAAPLAAGLAAVVFGWFCIRLTGVYLAMLTLAFAQIVWSIAYQWDAVTGGSTGIACPVPAAGRSGAAWYCVSWTL